MILCIMQAKIMNRNIEALRHSYVPVQQLEQDEVISLQKKLKNLRDTFCGSGAKETEIQSHYGLKEAVGNNMSLFLAYTDLVDEYRFLKEGYLKNAEAQRREYEKEKGEINSTNLGPGRKRQKLDEAYARRRKDIEEFSKNSQKAEEMEYVVLKSAVVDLFSWNGNSTETGEPLVIQNFVKLINEAKEYFENPESKANEYFRERKPIDYFINALSQYLKTTKDLNLFTQYAYRKNPDLITTEEDCLVLDTMITLAFDYNSINSRPETISQLESLGTSYLYFLRNRSWVTGDLEKYPILTFVYDLTTTAFYRGKPSTLDKIFEFTDKLYEDIAGSNLLTKELNSLGINVSSTVLKHHSECEEISKKLMTGEHRIGVSSELLDALTSKESRIFYGIDSFISTLINDRVFTDKKNVFIKYLSKQITNRVRKQIKSSGGSIIDIFRMYGLSYRNDVSINMVDVLSSRGVNVDLLKYTYSIGKISPVLDEDNSEGKELINVIYDSNGHHAISEQIRILTRASKFAQEHCAKEQAYFLEMLNLYCLIYEDKIKREESTEKENDYLWTETLDNLEWFVSPRGDRFTLKNDPQLSELGIESITFSVDSQHPRDHKVEVLVIGLDEPFELWLDIHRNLLGKSRITLALNPTFKQEFTNLLLKRLYLITSGLLSREGKIVLREEGGKKLILNYRRAHYTHLFSTSTRRITMESPQAVKHADKIRGKYGIDIFKEIARRRALGTLKPNEYVTFTDETISDIKGLVLVPNDLRFKPELLNLPIL
jgi:hypothetical protein